MSENVSIVFLRIVLRRAWIFPKIFRVTKKKYNTYSHVEKPNAFGVGLSLIIEKKKRLQKSARINKKRETFETILNFSLNDALFPRFYWRRNKYEPDKWYVKTAHGSL